MALSYLTSAAAKRFTSRIGQRVKRRLSAKQLAAARRNIKKAIAARTRKAGASIKRTARNPVKAYGRSINKRTTKTRLRTLKKTTTRLNKAKSETAFLKERLDTATRGSRIFSGESAIRTSNYEALDAIYKSNVANLTKRGDQGLLGSLRKRSVRNALREASEAKSVMTSVNTQAVAAQRAKLAADRLVALNESQTISLTNSYAKLSRGNSVRGYASTLGKDVLTVGAITATGLAAYRRSEQNKKK